MNFRKPPIRSRKYLDWVKSLPCVATGAPADDPHHIIGCGLGGATGSKPSDIFTIPLTRDMHNLLHHDVNEWELHYGSQALHCLRTIERAVRDGVIKL